LRVVGELFGEVLRNGVARVQGWQVIESYSALSATSTGVAIFVHDGSSYIRASSLEFDGLTMA
jgi:hypothetical protein